MELQFNNLLNIYLNNEEKENDDICLISYENLTEDHVTLQCGHKFNYKYLYDEVVSQKNKKNFNEIVTLLKNEIKCPYCRTIHKKLLPYNSRYPYDKYIMSKKTEKRNTCIAILKSGPRKGEICNRQCDNNLCYIHRKYKITIV